MLKQSAAIWLILALTIFCASRANSTEVVKRNLAELVQLSEKILVGKVITLSDGIDARTSAPYTEVTIQLAEGIKGSFNGEVFTFRQFGLLKPRLSADGRYTNLMLTPPGFPFYEVGENVMLFLYREGAITGFCTTIGLQQGKFKLENAQIVNGTFNQDLFRGLSNARLDLTREEKKLLMSKRGPLSAELFISVVKKLAKQHQ